MLFYKKIWRTRMNQGSEQIENLNSDSTDTTQEDILDRSESEDQELSIVVRYTVSSYGADYPVDGLVKRLKSEDIKNPDFQRGFVWKWGQASRFIESLLLGLPVPGIFLSKDPESQKLFVIDGQQRLITLRSFYEGILNGKVFKLKGVQEEFEGLTYKTLNENDRRRIDDSIIHATIIKQEDPKNDHSSIHLVFERLNTSGTPLSAQEIRRCVFSGAFDELNLKLNSDQNWRGLYGNISSRAKDQELILRFFALFYNLNSYQRPMKLFLSEFMGSNRNLEIHSHQKLSTLFEKTVQFLNKHIGPKAFRPERSLNVAVADAILVGTGNRLERGEVTNQDGFIVSFNNLLKNDEFLEKCKSATTDKENIFKRISLAKEAFEGIE